jgi:N-glycosylase/DNA lyase
MTCKEDLVKFYKAKKTEIKKRLNEFRQIWKRQDNKEIFSELVFCLLTPQSKARTCWIVVSNLLKNNVLWSGDFSQILCEVQKVRFKNNKTRYIEEARRYFSKNGQINIVGYLKHSDIFELRDRLVKDIKGIGYKEASHFLRNIGFGENITILDRHILKNLKAIKVIDDIPKSLTRNKYSEIENKMMVFAKSIKIPAAHLDLVFWCKETGEIFK